MENRFNIPWNNTEISVDVKGDYHDLIFMLHLPEGDKHLVLDTDENGTQHWIEPGLGETAFATEIGMLIETQQPGFLRNGNYTV